MSIAKTLLGGALLSVALSAHAETLPIPIAGYGAFGDGIARQRIGQSEGRDSAQAAHLQADGRLILGGTSSDGPLGAAPNRFSFTRLLPDGRLDTSFGPNGQGVFALDVASGGQMVDMFVDAAGGLVFAGSTTQDTGVVAKASSDGVLISSFGQNGRRSIGGGLFFDTAVGFVPRRMVNSRTGAILVAGLAASSDSACAGLVKLTAQGNFDTSFGRNGAACLAPARNGPPLAAASDIVELENGSLLISGGALRAGGTAVDMFVARVSSAGALDTSFGGGGTGFAFVAFDLGGALNDFAYALGVDAEGRILLAGQTSVDLPNGGDDIAMARLGPNGLIDTTFADEGRFVASKVIGPAKHSRVAWGVQVLADRRILVSGTTSVANGLSTALLLSEVGALEERFGAGGLFLQSDESAPRDRIISPVPRNVALRGDHLYVFGDIEFGPPNPVTGASSRAFGVAKYLMPLMRDGFDG